MPKKSLKNTLTLASLVESYLNAYFELHTNHLPPNLHGTIMSEVERPLLQLVMEKCEGNQKKAAAVLGINRNTLRKKLIDNEPADKII